MDVSKPQQPAVTKKHLGMLVLLLAAETVAGCVAHEKPVTSAEMLARETFVRSPIRPMEGTFDSRSSDTDSIGASTPESRDEYALVQKESHRGFFAQEAAAIGLILAFLPWRTALKLRRVSRLWFEQSMNVVAICRMPKTGIPAVFIPCNKDLDATADSDEQIIANNGKSVEWVCDCCGYFNHERRILCGNRNCQNASPAHRSSTRVFLGQLRREGTVSMIRWLFNDVLGASDALSDIENHRHKVTNRGKGCAWVYVSDNNVADELLGLHRRSFFDTFEGVEGMWIVRPTHTEDLETEIKSRGFSMTHERHMPRSAFVAELPVVQPQVPSAAFRPPPSYDFAVQAPAIRNLSGAGPCIFTRKDGVVRRQNNPYFVPEAWTA